MRFLMHTQARHKTVLYCLDTNNSSVAGIEFILARCPRVSSSFRHTKAPKLWPTSSQTARDQRTTDMQLQREASMEVGWRVIDFPPKDVKTRQCPREKEKEEEKKKRRLLGHSKSQFYWQIKCSSSLLFPIRIMSPMSCSSPNRQTVRESVKVIHPCQRCTRVSGKEDIQVSGRITLEINSQLCA